MPRRPEEVRAPGRSMTGDVLGGTPHVVHTLTSVRTTTFTPQEDLRVEHRHALP